MKFIVATFLTLISAVSASVTSLTPDNFDSATAGKSVFIKFFAPWCGHCKAMAGDWEKLAMDYQSSTEALIAEVDCTNDVNQSICTENGVQGFPTLKYGNPAALEDYEGGRDYESLKSFAQDNLKPTCSPFHLDLCQGEEKEKIESFFAMSEADLKAKIEAVDEIVKKSEEEFEKEVEKLQDMYMKMMEEHEKKLQEEKNNANYKLIKAVVAFKKTQESDGEL